MRTLITAVAVVAVVSAASPATAAPTALWSRSWSSGSGSDCVSWADHYLDETFCGSTPLAGPTKLVVRWHVIARGGGCRLQVAVAEELLRGSYRAETDDRVLTVHITARGRESSGARPMTFGRYLPGANRLDETVSLTCAGRGSGWVRIERSP